MDLNIREAIKDDYSEISKLISEVYNLHLINRPDVYLDINNPFEEQQFDELLNSKNVKVFVVEDSDSKELLAYSVVQIMTTKNPTFIQKTFVFIDDFCVKSKVMKKGIGRLLFKHIVDYSKKENATSLQLNVWEFNKVAIKFYEAMGMNTRNRRMELDV